MRYYFVLLFIITIAINSLAQTEKRTTKATRISDPPKIDGVLEDPAWQNISPIDNFIQYSPHNDGRMSCFPTEVKLLYDDDAFYVGALMHDPAPDSILRELSERDFDNVNADVLSIDLLPFNDGLNAFDFKVSAAGVQADMKHSASSHDEEWDAVWESAVRITGEGWVVELRIPYSALRFPKKDIHTWGLNVWRLIRRKREWSTWNYIDRNVSNTFGQYGEITGIKSIEPPLRLSFMPYASGYLEKNPDQENWGYDFNGGMDLKYGINESFTLDMTLIPDFGQVQSDDVIYNFSPFEVRYDEKRQFFTEGTELFNKAGIFYSRRIGDTPDDYATVADSLKTHERIKENPLETPLINATKVSGRTSGGLGIGVLNAMTNNARAIVVDTITGKTRKITTQAFTNYNIMVIDQNLKNNSYVSLINTNYWLPKDKRASNVTGSEFEFRDKNNKYRLSGTGIVSQKYSKTGEPEPGHKYSLGVSKTSGNFQFEIHHGVESDTYDPNDMGFLRNNNEFGWYGELEYNLIEPTNIYNEWRNSIDFWHQSLYAPRKFIEWGMEIESQITLKNYMTTGIEIGGKPVDEHDFFEAREAGRVFIKPPDFWFFTWLSPDYRNPFIVDMRLSFHRRPDFNKTEYNLNISPRWRVSNHLNIRHNIEFNKSSNERGYVTKIDDAGSIIFGKRNFINVTNTLNVNYIFNAESSFSFRMRHYWISTDYDRFYKLQEDGSLINSPYNENADFTQNLFNIDMKYRWQFAPGSELSLVWKNAILSYKDQKIENFFNNIENTLQSPASNSFSVKILYYLDYQYLTD